MRAQQLQRCACMSRIDLVLYGDVQARHGAILRCQMMLEPLGNLRSDGKQAGTVQFECNTAAEEENFYEFGGGLG